MHKPFMTVSDQVELLSRRGLKTDSRTAWVLEREGYYSVINGYKGPFLDTKQTQEAGDDRYRDGTSFNGSSGFRVCWVHGCEICSCMVCLNPPACRRLLVT